jgi:adenine-specific DNA-methyltransferase
MQGNSLISEFMGINFDSDKEKNSNPLLKDKTDELIELFRQKKYAFLNESNVSQKTNLKEEIDNLLVEIFETKLKTQKTDFFNRLKNIENRYSVLPNENQRNKIIKQEKQKLYKDSGFNLETAEKQLKEFTSGRQIKPFFLWNLYFSEVFQGKGGFDVVIGNPPYKGFQYLDKKFKSILRKSFVSTQGKFDIYIAFIEQSYHILRENGFFVFICPTAFTKREHGKQIRKFLLANVCLDELVDFEHSQMFENATNYTGIFSFIKSVPINKNTFSYRTGFSEGRLYCSQHEMSEDSWVFTDTQSKNILDILCKNQPLGRIAFIKEGVVTGLNKLYLKTAQALQDESLEKEYFFPTLRGKEIDKYHLRQNSEWLFYPYILDSERTVPIEETILKKQCPNLYFYLKSNLQLINSRNYFISSSKKWYELWNQRNLSNFLDEKIVTPELSDSNKFVIAPSKIFYGDTVCGISIKNDFKNQIDIKCLLAILNSRLIEWYYKKTTVPKAGGFFIYKVMYLKAIPIKIGSHSDQKPLVDLANKILAITKHADYLKNPAKQAQVKEYENQIDQLVYQLYDLTEEEIKIVEGATK